MMATQKKKPLPGQPRKVEPLTQKVEAAAPPHPQLEVLHERMDHLATREQVNKLHGEAMGRIDVLQERMGQLATKAEMYKLHEEAMERINQTATAVEVLKERTSQMPTRAEMYDIRNELVDRIGRVETCMGELKSELKFIRWIGGALGVAIIAGLVRIIFFPVV